MCPAEDVSTKTSEAGSTTSNINMNGQDKVITEAPTNNASNNAIEYPPLSPEGELKDNKTETTATTMAMPATSTVVGTATCNMSAVGSTVFTQPLNMSTVGPITPTVGSTGSMVLPVRTGLEHPKCSTGVNESDKVSKGEDSEPSPIDLRVLDSASTEPVDAETMKSSVDMINRTASDQTDTPVHNPKSSIDTGLVQIKTITATTVKIPLATESIDIDVAVSGVSVKE